MIVCFILPLFQNFHSKHCLQYKKFTDFFFKVFGTHFHLWSALGQIIAKIVQKWTEQLAYIGKMTSKNQRDKPNNSIFMIFEVSNPFSVVLEAYNK